MTFATKLILLSGCVGLNIYFKSYGLAAFAFCSLLIVITLSPKERGPRDGARGD